MSLFPKKKPGRYAAIDLGTNSFHLIIVQVDEQGRYEVLTTEKETVRLSRGAGDLEQITGDTMDRAVAVLQRMASIAASHGARVRAVGTSALREASNQAEFVARVEQECGLEIEVIPGTEEARLIYLGVLQALPVQEERVLVIDIGGGSTELLVGLGGQVDVAASLKLGAIRLTDRFFSEDPLDTDQIRRCRKFVRVALAGIIEEILRTGFRGTVGCSGTIETIAELAFSMRRDGTGAAQLSGKELDASCERILSARTVRERAALPGVGEARADIIPAGAVILQEAARILEVRTLTVSPFALREGIVFDMLARAGLRSGPGSDLRQSSVRHLAESFGRTGAFDAAAGKHTAVIAQRLLDQCLTCNLLSSEFSGGAHAQVLAAAAELHNIGVAVSHSGHHKHSYYIIKNSSKLLGFSPAEVDTIALLARYHRKALPSKKHAEFEQASTEVQRHVRALGPLLRIAVGLDRSGHGNVADVVVEKSERRVLFLVVPKQGSFSGATDPAVEIWAARMKALWFEETFGVETEFGVSYAK